MSTLETGFGTNNHLAYELHNPPPAAPKREKNISISSYNIFQLMLIFMGVYFNCEVLKISNLIASSSYVSPTVGLYAYDLLFSVLITLPLVKMPEIMGNTFNVFVYYILCNIGGLGFALLGEVPFLQAIVIEKGFWKHLTPAAFCTIGFFALIIGAVTVREIISAWRNKTFSRQLINILIFVLFYGVIFIILNGGGATGIHWHVHHAIFAGFLSLWFVNWENTIEMCMHAIMMGIVVEGINFYSIQELYLFISNAGSFVEMRYAVLISALYFVALGAFKICTRNY